MLDIVPHTALQQHGQPGDVARYVLLRRVDRIAHTGLGGQLHDLPKFMRPE